MDFRNEPFFDNHTHLLNMDKFEIVPAELALNFLHGYRDEVDANNTPVASAEWVGHVSELGVVKTLVSFLSRYLNCEATLEAVVEARNRAARDDYAAYIKGLYQDQNILAEVLDSELPIDSPKISCFPVKVLRLFRYEDVYFSLLKTEDSFAVLWDKLEQAVRQAVAEGFIGLKGHVGEKFTMAVREVTPEQAEAVFAAAKSGNRQACEDVYFAMFSKLLLLCQELDVTLHLHSGCTGLRSNPDVPQLDPLLMVPFLKQQKYMKSKIVFLHQSYPYTRNAALMAFSFPNVYVDLSWVLPWMSLSYKNCIEDALSIAPHSKILLGTGQHHYPEMVWMAAKIAKRALKDALEEMVDREVLTEEQAVKTAQMVLYGNGTRLYHLDRE